MHSHVSRMIEDVVDPFDPTVAMSVQFGEMRLINGSDVRPSMAMFPPMVTITGLAYRLYTLLMVDPDAPRASRPTLKEYLHWVVVDIPGESNWNRGREIVEYQGPDPGASTGIHRYVMVLFEQNWPLLRVAPEEPSTRNHFTTRLYARELGLGPPVAALYFVARRHAAN